MNQDSLNIENINNSDVTLLKLSLQRALLGAVSSNLYAVTASLSSKLIRVDAYLYESRERDCETIQVVTSEVLADFPADYQIEENCFSLTHTQPNLLDFWVFLREAQTDMSAS